MSGTPGGVKNILTYALVLCGSVAAGLIVRYIIIRTLKAAGKKDRGVLFKSLATHIGGPLYILLPLIALSIAMEMLDISRALGEAASQAAVILFILAISWLLAKLTFVFEDLILLKFRIDVKDNLKARKVYTQVQFFKRIVIIAIGIIAIAVILMSFSRVRQVGTALLASAGVIGIEWGRIEEITLTYVVVRIWDLRRLVLPITYFLEKPFQNWTRESARLLCTVFVYTDYTVPVEEIRQELFRILQKSAHWDKEVWNLQVTGTNEKSMELRALMSAQDGPTAWNLRCEVRERLVDYIRRAYPGSLPKVRTDITMTGDGSEGASRGSPE